MLAVDSSLDRDRGREVVDLSTAYHLRNSYLTMSHGCSCTQTLVICSCCEKEEK